VELQTLDLGRRVVPVVLRQVGEVSAPQLRGPVVEGRDADVLHPEGREHVAHVVAQGTREDQEEGAVRVDLFVRVGEVRDAVQRHRGLARTRAAPNGEEARARSRNQLELGRVDEPGDLREALVRTSPAALEVGAQSTTFGLAHLVPPHGGGLAAPKLRPRFFELVPRAAVFEKDALGRLDAVEARIPDPQGAARLHVALAPSPAKGLLVVFALAVAVEDLRHRGVAPVDDAQAGVDAGGAPQEEVPGFVVFGELQVGEVGGGRVDLHLVLALADLLEERALAVPLLAQRHRILAFRVGDQLLAHPGELADDRCLIGPLLGRSLREELLHLFEERKLFSNDRIVPAHALTPDSGGLEE
jgi:hypothetical protein